MNQMEKWLKNRVIYMHMCEASRNEAFAGNNKDRRNKAMKFITSMTFASTPAEHDMINNISSIIFPDGINNQNQKNDIEIVFNAWKYAAILVTNDGASKSQPNGILGTADKLKELSIRVVTDEQAVMMVRKAIDKRDQRAIRISNETGINLPNWVGQD